MNNFIKILFNNFCEEFEGCNPQELQQHDPHQYNRVLNWFVRSSTVEDLNDELYYILKELYLIEINNPVKYLFYKCRRL